MSTTQGAAGVASTVSTSSLRSLKSELAAAAQKVTPTTLPHDQIDPSRRQPRKKFHDATIDELAATIRAAGKIIQPLVVRRKPDGRYEIVVGERRWRAAPRAGIPGLLAAIPVVVRELSDTDAFADALVENLDREDMDLIDEVRGVAQLVEDTSVQEAARRLGKSAQWISKRTRVARAPAFVTAFVDSGEVRDLEALYELAILADTDPAGSEQLIAGYKKGTHLREKVAQLRKSKKSGAGNDGVGEGQPPGAGPKSETNPDDHGSGDAGEGDPPSGRATTEATRRQSTSSSEGVVRVDRIELRDGTFHLLTARGPIVCELSSTARRQLRRLLDA